MIAAFVLGAVTGFVFGVATVLLVTGSQFRLPL